jgi:hypothetical protein
MESQHSPANNCEGFHSADFDGNPFVETWSYHSIVGMVMYTVLANTRLNIYLMWKAQLIARGHQSDPPQKSTYSSVESRDSIRIAFTLSSQQLE